MTSDFKRALGIFSILIIVAVLVVFGPAISQRFAQQPAATQDPATSPPSAYVKAQLAKSTGAEYLVSYTDQGFDPANLNVDQYLTVRFTNNSSGNLWVSTTGLHDIGDTNPSDCNHSAFDSCYAVPPHEFWEYTFVDSGTIQYENILNKAMTGTIRVIPED